MAPLAGRVLAPPSHQRDQPRIPPPPPLQWLQGLLPLHRPRGWLVPTVHWHSSLQRGRLASTACKPGARPRTRRRLAGPVCKRRRVLVLVRQPEKPLSASVCSLQFWDSVPKRDPHKQRNHVYFNHVCAGHHRVRLASKRPVPGGPAAKPASICAVSGAQSMLLGVPPAAKMRCCRGHAACCTLCWTTSSTRWSGKCGSGEQAPSIC